MITESHFSKEASSDCSISGLTTSPIFPAPFLCICCYVDPNLLFHQFKVLEILFRCCVFVFESPAPHRHLINHAVNLTYWLIALYLECKLFSKIFRITCNWTISLSDHIACMFIPPSERWWSKGKSYNFAKLYWYVKPQEIDWKRMNINETRGSTLDKLYTWRMLRLWPALQRRPSETSLKVADYRESK